MTKTVRIENADNWIDIKTIELNHPTSMASEYLTTSRRIVIEENGTN